MGRFLEAQPKLSFLPEAEEQEPIAQFRELAMQFLEAHGLVERAEGRSIVDIDALSKADDGLVNYTDKGYRYFKRRGIKANDQTRAAQRTMAELTKSFPAFHHNTLGEFLLNAFRGLPVIDKAEWQAWKNGERPEPPEAKPLLYEPKDARAAFDVDAIKKSKFHKGLWEIGGDKEGAYSPLHPDLPYEEAALAAITYHPAKHPRIIKSALSGVAFYAPCSSRCCTLSGRSTLP
ncbi:MAG: hypothetical protein AAB932_03985 [Patescibacteria group bacterium]